MRFGHFDDARREYVIDTPRTPLPWINYLGSEDFFSLVSNTGGGYSFYRDARLRRLTRYRYNNSPLDMDGHRIYINDGGTIWNPGWQPTKTPLDSYSCRHGLGYTILEGKKDGVTARQELFVPKGDACELDRVTVCNESAAVKELDLFSFSDNVGPGLVLWHPKGAFIRNAFETYWRAEHYRNGYELLYTPHIGQSILWETSGHLDFYREGMYSSMQIDEKDYYVKPMNCPFHIEVYQSRLRSYRELPLRWAELGTVYRYEKSGALHGLLRVRGFTQDDSHIICTPEQIEDEIAEVLRFSLYIWKSFGFTEIKPYLSTRPAKAVGEPERWEKALVSLRKAIDKLGLECEVDEGGGAFYGPKIDLKVKDAIGREWQTATIQFDFNLPERFDMTYIGEDGKKHRPYMVHRALMGSLERFFGILIEQYAGAFPLWLAPIQARILPVSDRQHDAAMALK